MEEEKQRRALREENGVKNRGKRRERKDSGRDIEESIKRREYSEE